MEALIKASGQYQAVANEDDINVNVEIFNEYMKKLVSGITIAFNGSVIQVWLSMKKWP